MSKRTFYWVFDAVMLKLRATIEVAQAVGKLRSDPFPLIQQLDSIVAFAAALRPGPDATAQAQIRGWEDRAAKDERRAVRVLFADYESLQKECVALLATQVGEDVAEIRSAGEVVGLA